MNKTGHIFSIIFKIWSNSAQKHSSLCECREKPVQWGPNFMYWRQWIFIYTYHIYFSLCLKFNIRYIRIRLFRTCELLKGKSEGYFVPFMWVWMYCEVIWRFEDKEFLDKACAVVSVLHFQSCFYQNKCTTYGGGWYRHTILIFCTFSRL